MAIGVLTAGALALLSPEMALAAGSAQPTVGLGTADAYEVIGGTTVTNTGPSILNNGDLGLSPGTAVTGFPPGLINNGVKHAADAQALQAQTDVTTAYNDAAGRTPDVSNNIDLAGQTLVPGVYAGNTLSLNGTVTLNGGPNDVFIFQAASTLITGSASVVAFTGGATACNVFWQVGSSATLGTASSFAGTILALTSITATTGATVTGRLFARNGAVTLDSNVITRPAGCAARSAILTSTKTPAQTAAAAAVVAHTAAVKTAAAQRAAVKAAAAKAAAKKAAAKKAAAKKAAAKKAAAKKASGTGSTTAITTGSGAGGSGDELARTGIDLAPYFLASAALLFSGLALLLIDLRRRRKLGF
jgi:Ice-binding-like